MTTANFIYSYFGTAIPNVIFYALYIILLQILCKIYSAMKIKGEDIWQLFVSVADWPTESAEL